MAVSLSDTFQSQYFVQDKEGNVWGEIKPTNISIGPSYGTLLEIELTGYLSVDNELANQPSTESWVISENDKRGNEMEILEIYEKRKSDKLWSKLKEAKEKIIKADEITKRVAEFKEKLEEDYNMYVGVDLNIGTLTKESEEEIAKAEYEHDVELHALKEGIKEIKAQLGICENYEQKMNILIAYGIIDKKTKQILA